ncbi:BnaC02g09810D [Brassica napus]|uniref:BnaC02g09810D protein n=1 Tax=Brassica napus TaxID=3708 RepID=A0A078HBD4_BRANA|nr:BnaC02g09810D [Brassica napus]
MEGSKRSLSRRLRREQDHADNHTTTIPFDLIIEILSLLPAKSLIRFQSISSPFTFHALRIQKTFHIIRSRTQQQGGG